jgi:uncharacterized damage-inducible protein DinB
MMKQLQPLQFACALTIISAGLLVAAPAAAQQPAVAPVSLQASLATDAGTLSDKFVGLARVMAGKYDWRPGQGVRSVGEVFNLIVTENRMLTGLLTGASQGSGPGGQSAQPAPITDAAAMQEALKGSYAGLSQALAGLSASDLATNIKMFGRDMTKQGAALLLLMDQHEHLGQSIAYARTNAIVPPWSK